MIATSSNNGKKIEEKMARLEKMYEIYEEIENVSKIKPKSNKV